MIIRVLVTSVLSALVHARPPKGHLGIVPLPAEYTLGQTPICLSPDFSITTNSLGGDLPEDLWNAIIRTTEALRRTQHTYLSTEHGREHFPNEKCGAVLESLVLHYDVETDESVVSIKEDATRLVEDRVELEGYTLDVPLGPEATLSSKSSLGLFRGLTTFQQLFYALPSVSGAQTRLKDTEAEYEFQEEVIYDTVDESVLNDQHLVSGQSPDIFAPSGPYHIEDKPTFGWRGVMLDTSRHFLSKETIKKQLDVMAMVKLNVLHWYVPT